MNKIARLEKQAAKLQEEIQKLQQELKTAQAAKQRSILNKLDMRKEKLARINAEITRAGLNAFWQAATH